MHYIELRHFGHSIGFTAFISSFIKTIYAFHWIVAVLVLHSPVSATLNYTRRSYSIKFITADRSNQRCLLFFFMRSIWLVRSIGVSSGCFLGRRIAAFDSGGRRKRWRVKVLTDPVTGPKHLPPSLIWSPTDFQHNLEMLRVAATEVIY